MNQNHRKKCLKGGEHKQRHIEAVCLQQSCKSDRLLCFYCIHQSHDNHQIVYLLQGLDSPIQKLGVNSQIENREEHEKYIRKKIKKINHGWKNLYKIFASYINQIETNLQPQIEAIQDSFDENSAQKFAQVITGADTTPQTVEKYVERIKMIMKYDLSDVSQLKLSTGMAYEDLKQAYASANKEIATVMQKIVKQANLFTVLNCDLGASSKRESRLGIDDRNKVSISIEKDKFTVNSYESRFEGSKMLCKRVENRWLEKRNQLLKPNNNILKPMGKRQLQNLEQKGDRSSKSSPKKSENLKQMSCEIEEENRSQQSGKIESLVKQGSKVQGEINCSEDSKKEYEEKLSQNQLQRQQKYAYFFAQELSEQQDESMSNQIANKNRVNADKPNLQGEKELNNRHQEEIHDQREEQHAQINAEEQQKHQNHIEQSQQSQEYSSEDSEFARYRNHQYSDSQNSLTPPIIDLKQIYLNCSSHSQIYHYLSKIPTYAFSYIRSLQIVCDTLPLAVNNQIMGLVVQFKSLKKLVICQASGIKRENIVQIVTQLTQLEHLVLEQNYGIDIQIAQMIVKKLKKLKKFHYTSDPLEHLLFKQQNTEFVLEVDGNTKFQAFKKLTEHPHMQTFAIQNVLRVKQAKNHLIKVKKISELSILYHYNQHNISAIIEMLAKADSVKSLISLELKQGYFKEDALIQVIKNCIALKSLSFNKCQDVTNSTISALKKHKNTLKQLDLMEQDQITGQGFENFNELQILSLKACWQIQQELLGKNLLQMPKLKALNLNFNRYWLTEHIFDDISKVKNLEILQIDNNKINYKGLFKLRFLTKLSTIVCGNTELGGDDIVKFFSLMSSKIQKLSLKRQNFEQKSLKNEIRNKPFEGSILQQITKYAPGITHLNIKGMKKVAKDHLKKLSKCQFYEENLKCLCVDSQQLDKETLNLLKQRRVSLYVGYSHFEFEAQDEQKDRMNQSDKKEIKVKLEQ